MQKKKLIRIGVITAAILMIPFIAMFFTDEVNWTLFDFIVAGVMLSGTGLVYEFVAQKVQNNAYKIAVAIAAFTGLLLMWVNLAVGIIGNENNPVNLMYFGVIALGIIGVIFARFEPSKMSLVLFAIALTQLLVPIIALVAFSEVALAQEYLAIAGVLGINAFFAALWSGSALMFRKAAFDKMKVA